MCENTGAGNREDDQRLCFRYLDSVGAGRKPECWFSRDAAQFMMIMFLQPNIQIFFLFLQPRKFLFFNSPVKVF